jgi:hypothetical protein
MRARSGTALVAVGLSVAWFAGCAAEPEARRPGPGTSNTATGGGGNLPPDPTAPATGGAPAATTVLQLSPHNLACNGSDPPVARRVSRLPPSELLAAYRAVGTVEPASVPPGFDTTVLGEAPRPDDAVSKDWHQNLDSVATALGKRMVQDPQGLGCPVSEFGTNAACTTAYLQSTTQQFFRGRVAAGDVESLVSLAQGVAGRSDGATALEYAVRAMALSPKAIYLTEGLDRAGAGTVPEPMSAEEAAAFLSFRIKKEPPSAQLLQALRQAGPLDEAKLRAAIDQQFTPAELTRGATELVASWLNVAALGTSTTKDTNKHPTFTKDFLVQLQQEMYDTLFSQFLSTGADMNRLFTEQVRSNLLGDNSNALVAEFGRPGVLSLPGLITSISAPEHTDLPKRGKFLVNALFCDGAQPPPPGIQFPELPPGLTERQKFEAIEAQPGCGPCHTRINPLAYPMERYDEVGNPRALDDIGNMIDTSGAHALVPGGPREFTYTDAADLGAKVAAHPLAHVCFSIQAFEYIARRRAAAPTSTNRNDSCAVQGITNDATLNGLKLNEWVRDTLVRVVAAPRAD